MDVTEGTTHHRLSCKYSGVLTSAFRGGWSPLLLSRPRPCDTAAIPGNLWEASWPLAIHGWRLALPLSHKFKPLTLHPASLTNELWWYRKQCQGATRDPV